MLWRSTAAKSNEAEITFMAECENISRYVSRRDAKISGIVAGDEPGQMPHYRSSKILRTPLFGRLRNHTFDGHISRLEQDRNIAE